MCRGRVDGNASICINTQHSIWKQSNSPFTIGVPIKEKKDSGTFLSYFLQITFT